jgi:hypothetical protein
VPASQGILSPMWAQCGFMIVDHHIILPIIQCWRKPYQFETLGQPKWRATEAIADVVDQHRYRFAILTAHYTF